MKIVTAYSVEKDQSKALEAIGEEIQKKLGTNPDYMMAFYTENYNAKEIAADLAGQFETAQLQGCSSCQFVMTDEGIHGEDGYAIGVLAMADHDGDFGVGHADMGEDPNQAATDALLAAIENSGRMGETPSLVWLTSSPGCEEQVIEGITNVIGADVPIFGGSAADNTVAGNWSLIANQDVVENGVTLAAFYPSDEVNGYFHNGYSPTDKVGTVTRAEGRSILEIDGQPAAQVYNDWSGGVIETQLKEGGNVLMDTTFQPLGRVVGNVGGVDYFNLSHPESIGEGGRLNLFTNISEGDEIVCMTGARDGLIARAGRVAKTAQEMRTDDTTQTAGALIIYCAGCMLSVGEQKDEVVSSIKGALGDAPFLGGFTFGEQGCFNNGKNGHGNLMISAVNFATKG
ncbi:FIST N-terminal domain-containing protein [Terasakiella sp. SH-1]|uniref:FIST signal transduction protein n=1 Tax=Terasakiella sp. SH-1 TaxID=2560057 RepID=UPI0010747940|nr:FIST N-terminal domain-containing protein [Terasakiella sp. SH-1]